MKSATPSPIIPKSVSYDERKDSNKQENILLEVTSGKEVLVNAQAKQNIESYFSMNKFI